MKHKPKSTKSVILIIALTVIGILIAKTLGFASTRTATRIGYIGNEGWSTWSGFYTLLDGTMEKSVYPKGDNLHIAVETEEGTISIAIKDADGNMIFDDNNIGTTSFDAEVPGKVIVRIIADHHKGSFAITSGN